MTDRAFTLLFFGIVNLFDLAMIALLYYTGAVGGLSIMILVSIMIALVSISVLWEEFFPINKVNKQ